MNKKTCTECKNSQICDIYRKLAPVVLEADRRLTLGSVIKPQIDFIIAEHCQYYNEKEKQELKDDFIQESGTQEIKVKTCDCRA